MQTPLLQLQQTPQEATYFRRRLYVRPTYTLLSGDIMDAFALVQLRTAFLQAFNTSEDVHLHGLSSPSALAKLLCKLLVLHMHAA